MPGNGALGRDPDADTGQVDANQDPVGLVGDPGAGTAGAAGQVDNAITGAKIEHVTYSLELIHTRKVQMLTPGRDSTFHRVPGPQLVERRVRRP